MVRYKACCGATCMVAGCETKDAGGCYCVCRLMDAKNSLEMIIDGKMLTYRGGQIWIPDEKSRSDEFENWSLDDQNEHIDYRVNIAPQLLQETIAKLKEYEITDEEG